jgi:hypothetical protein
MEKQMIAINGEAHEITKIYSHYPEVVLDDGTEWIVFESRETAGEAAREYWEDMARNDPKEFTCMVGEETLVSWALGQYAGPGSTQVKSLEEWLDLHLDCPEEHFGSYDGSECDCQISRNARDELNLPEDCKQAVCYRHN